MKQYQNEHGTTFAVREKDGAPRLMCLPKGGAEWMLSGVLAACAGDATTAEELQAVLDRAAHVKGWKECETETSSPAPTGAAAATTDGSAAISQPTRVETTPTSESGAGASTPTPGASPSGCSLGQDCPADSEAASPGPYGLPAAVPASFAGATTFDFSALDTETAEKLRGITDCVLELYQSYAWGMAYQVGKAHDLLCGGDGSCETVSQLHKANGNRGENTFTAWCAYVGVERRSAYNLLNAYRLICKATPEQQKNLQLAPARLLYDAGRKDAPEQLSAAVLDGDITTHKEYQKLLKQYRAKEAELAAALRYKAECERRAQDQQRLEGRVRGLEESYRTAHANEESALRRAAEAEKSLAGARDALQAAKLRGDKYRAENDALKARPIEVTAADPAEVARLADEKARALLAQWQAEQLPPQIFAEDAVPPAILTRPARLAALAESVVQGCAALIQAWLAEAFDATNTEEADSLAIFHRFAYGLEMALHNGEWPTNEEIELDRAGEELEGADV